MIHHLNEENRRLKEELELVREGHEIGVAEGKKFARGSFINDVTFLEKFYVLFTSVDTPFSKQW